MNQQDFDQLVEKYHNLVMSLIRRYYGGRFNQSAEDLSQEIWIKLWESFKKNENNIVNFKSYLYRTVQTTLWDAARTLDKDACLDPLQEGSDLAQNPEEGQIHQRLQLENILDRLKPEEARMMRAHLKGFSNQEIAVLLGCTEGRVRNLLSRIKNKMTNQGGS